MAEVSDELFAVMVLQHGLGLATAALLYGAGRRAGLRNGWALLPVVATVLLLGGAQLLLEHAILSEAHGAGGRDRRRGDPGADTRWERSRRRIAKRGERPVW